MQLNVIKNISPTRIFPPHRVELTDCLIYCEIGIHIMTLDALKYDSIVIFGDI